MNGRFTLGSLFSGIEGLGLGLERAGMEIRWQVELDRARQATLQARWPNVRRFGDVRAVRAAELERVDLVAGGFPCRDVSDAGLRAGIEGQQSGLWAEFARIVYNLRPRYVLVENVPGLLSRGMGRVVGDLAASGYDAEWDCVPAAAVGAPHLRVRLFLLAYLRGDRGAARDHQTIFAGRLQPELRARWEPEPEVARVVHGVPGRLDGTNWRARNAALGAAVVPQVAEAIGRMIIRHEAGDGV